MGRAFGACGKGVTGCVVGVDLLRHPEPQRGENNRAQGIALGQTNPSPEAL